MVRICFLSVEAWRFVPIILGAFEKAGMGHGRIEWTFEEDLKPVKHAWDMQRVGQSFSNPDLIIIDDRTLCTNGRIMEGLFGGYVKAKEIRKFLPKQKIWLFSRGLEEWGRKHAEKYIDRIIYETFNETSINYVMEFVIEIEKRK